LDEKSSIRILCPLGAVELMPEKRRYRKMNKSSVQSRLVSTQFSGHPRQAGILL
jgi:hypothetical protein